MSSASNSLTRLWQKERLGLLVLSSSLIVIFLVSIIIFRYQQKESELEIRAEGIRLIGLLSELGYSRLVQGNSRGLLEWVFRSQGQESNIAYVAVVSSNNQQHLESSPLSITHKYWSIFSSKLALRAFAWNRRF